MEKLTKLQRAVQREMERIITIIETKQKQGFSFTKLPSLDFDKTKARSKQLKMLRGYTPEKLMKEHSEWVNPETGEIYQKESGISAEAQFSEAKSNNYEREYNKNNYKPVTRLQGSANIGIIDTIRDKLAALPTNRRVKGGPIDLSDDVNSVMSAFEDMVGQADDEDELVEYLYNNEFEISKNCDIITHASQQYDIQDSFYKLIIIFNNGSALTMEQAERYEDEFSDNDIEYDFDDDTEW